MILGFVMTMSIVEPSRYVKLEVPNYYSPRSH